MISTWGWASSIRRSSRQCSASALPSVAISPAAVMNGVRWQDRLLETRQAARTAITVRELADRVKQEHLPKRKPKTQYDAMRILDRHIVPALGALAVPM
jgi:hypothetical protein